MEVVFVIGQIVSVMVLCCGAVLSVFAVSTAPARGERRGADE